MKLLLRYFCSGTHQMFWKVSKDRQKEGVISTTDYALLEAMQELFEQTRIRYKLCIYCGEKLKAARKSTI